MSESKSSLDDQITCEPEHFEWNVPSFIDNDHQILIDLGNDKRKVTNKSKKGMFKAAKSVEYSLSIEWGENKDEKVEKLYECYHKSNSDSVPFLLEDLELSEKQPRKDESIFFVITTCFADNLLLLGKR